MLFVLVVAVIVAAGWIYLAASADTRDRDTDTGDTAPANAYDNPYDTNENNDRPFEPDAAGDAPGKACNGNGNGRDND